MDKNLDFTCQILAVDIDSTLIKRAKELYGNSITFKCLDIMNNLHRHCEIDSYLKDNSLKKFNTIFCFSITMWIHLNCGDNGLRNFLKYIASITEILVIEPQPWKCYKAAVKRMKQQNFNFPLFHKLKIQQDIDKEIENYLLIECGLIKLSETDRTSWNRKLLIFRQPIDS